MSFFKPPIKYKQKIKCNKCYKEVLVTDAFCSGCGTKLTLLEEDVKNKEFKKEDLRDLYNYYYNSGDKLFSSNAEEVVELSTKLLYGSFPRETLRVIISSFRSGYALRKAENKIFPNEQINIELNLNELKKKYKEVYKRSKLFSKNKRAIDMLLLINDLSKGNYINYGKKIIIVYLDYIIKDNLDFLMPLLDQIYIGDRYLSIAGLPHIHKQEIELTEKIKNGWKENIILDTIGGYCMKLSEEILDSTTSI
jgi:hypothetical protein